MSSKLLSLLGGICVVLLAACAGTPTSSGTEGAAPAQASAGKSCRPIEPLTGTSIRRRECSDNDVQTVTKDDVREYRRESLGTGGK